MKVQTFNSIEDVHKIWNDETWIRYNEIESALPSGVYLTEEQEEKLFPSMPDYIVIDNTVYKPEVSEHLERYGRKVDSCSFYRVELIKVTDPEITDQILNTPEKMTEQLRERLEQKYPTLTELGLRFEIKLNFINKASEIQLVREDGKILALQWDYSSTEAEMDKWLYEAAQSFEFMKQVNQLMDEPMNYNIILRIGVLKGLTNMAIMSIHLNFVNLRSILNFIFIIHIMQDSIILLS